MGLVAANPAFAGGGPTCTDGSTPSILDTVQCTTPGTVTLTVPAGTTSVDADLIGGGGGAGYPARSHIGGNAAEVTGSLTLPAGTAYLYVMVGEGGSGDNHGLGFGGTGSAVFALDSSKDLLAKLVVAGAGGGGSYNGDGGNAGAPGTSENAGLAAPGQPASPAGGGSGGIGNYSNGKAGDDDDPTILTLATGGAGGTYPNNSAGGSGGGGYAGGGGGAVGNQGILNIFEAGGGGGSSLTSAYLSAASVAVAANTGGVQLPGLVAGDGTDGSVELTFQGAAVPAAPSGVTASPGDEQATIAFTAPSDNGSAITSYTVTASPGGETAACPSSPCTVTGLTNGTGYTFTVVATNGNGDSAASAPSSEVTPAVPPGAPKDVTATAGDGQASVAFTAPDSDGGSAVTSYTVTASPGEETATCPGSPCVVTGLDNGTSYTFSVVATNPVGDSSSSAPSSAVEPSGAPGVPTGVTLAPGDGKAVVSFTAPADGGSTITGYQYSTDAGTTWQTLTTTTSAGTVTGTVTGLTNGTAYSVTVRAVNSNGSGDASTAHQVTPAGVPDSPTGVSAVAGDHEAAVTFTAPGADGGSAITSYTVTSHPGGITKTCPGSPCVVPGLSNGTNYTFTVVATNAVGDSAQSTPSSPVSPSGTPDSPSNVSVQPGDGVAHVAFSAPSDGGAAITGYEYTLDDGATWHTLAVAASGTAADATITGLTNGTSYMVRIRAVNANGNGPQSVAKEVVPAAVPAVPTGIVAQAGNGRAAVTFTAPGNDGGSPITGYTVTAHPGGVTRTCPGSPCVVSGLHAGTTYTFTVTATNAAGRSVASVASDPVTVDGPPSTPTNVTVDSGQRKLTVSFPTPATNGSPITGFEYSTDGGHTWHRLDATVSGSTVRAVIDGLHAGTRYTVTVRAVNEFGVGDGSAGRSATTDKPAKPTPPKDSWYHDPLTTSQRARLSSIPDHPQQTHGKLRMTKAMYRSHNGTLAVSAGQVTGHQLTKGQAVQLVHLFKFDSATLTLSGRSTLKRLARSLQHAHSVTCEGYADYAGADRHEHSLSIRRALAVCHALAKSAGVRVRSVGYGGSRPVVIGGTAASRNANRRVDVVINR